MRALEVDPENSIAWTNKAVTLSGLGQRQAALGCYDRSLQIEPFNKVVWFSKGSLLFVLDRPLEAIACYDHILEKLDGRMKEALGAKSEVLKSIGKYHEALACLNEFLRLEPVDAQALAERASVMAALGESDPELQPKAGALGIRARRALRPLKAVATRVNWLLRKPTDSDLETRKWLFANLLGDGEFRGTVDSVLDRMPSLIKDVRDAGQAIDSSQLAFVLWLAIRIYARMQNTASDEGLPHEQSDPAGWETLQRTISQANIEHPESKLVASCLRGLADRARSDPQRSNNRELQWAFADLVQALGEADRFPSKTAMSFSVLFDDLLKDQGYNEVIALLSDLLIDLLLPEDVAPSLGRFPG